jgi:hypothetical protein
MPTTRRRRAQTYREPLEASMREHLLSGDLDAAMAAGAAAGQRMPVQLLCRGLEHPTFWAAYRDELIAEYVAAHPGWRPHGWWLYEATAPRRWIVDGHAVEVDIPPDWRRWRELWGIQPEDASGRRASEVESQPAYVRRHGLLTRAERARLRPADFEPDCLDDWDRLDPDEVEDEALEADESVPHDPCCAELGEAPAPPGTARVPDPDSAPRRSSTGPGIPEHHAQKEDTMNAYVPAGHRKVKILKATVFAREELSVGSLAVLDSDTAAKLVAQKIAEYVKDEPRAMIATACPRCSSPMTYPKQFEQSERWVQCGNGNCNHGWLR